MNKKIYEFKVIGPAVKKLVEKLRQSRLMPLIRKAFFRAKIDPRLCSIEITEPVFEKGSMLLSQLCTESQCRSSLYIELLGQIKEEPRIHRKLWEYVYIIKALKERNMLIPGKKGVGFGVGQEPLPALFANYGALVLATDYGFEAAAKAGWSQTNQFLSSKESLNARNIAPSDSFNKLVSICEIDMNHIPADIQGYDFTWSSCAFEHLGDIEKGLKFVENSLNVLRPGGIAVHTTEYNLSSNEKTLVEGGTVIFRKKDIEELVRRLTAAGHEIYLNYNPGLGKLDKYIDMAPYKDDPHLKLQLSRYVATSIGLIIRKKFE